MSEALTPLLAALAAAAPTLGLGSGGGAAATAGGSLAAAGTTGLSAGVTAGATGLSVGTALQAAGTVAALGSASAQLLADKPRIPAPPPIPSRDDAQREADLMSSYYRRRGRASTLLTPGGARGITSAPNLGSASLLGS